MNNIYILFLENMEFITCVSPAKYISSPESPISNKRCPNRTFNLSLFCKTHSNLFRKEYLKYKILESYIKLDLTSTDISALLKCYSQLEEAYNRRYKYRIKAFIPEAWDRGHDFKMRTILKDMSSIVSRLEVLFEAMISKESNVQIIQSKPKETQKIKWGRIKKKHSIIIKKEDDFGSIIRSYVEKDENLKEKSRQLYIKADKELQHQLQVQYYPDVLVVIDIIRYITSGIDSSNIVTPVTISKEYICKWKELMFFDKNIRETFKISYGKILKSNFCESLYRNVYLYMKNVQNGVKMCVYSVFNQQVYDFKGGYFLKMPLYSDKGKLLADHAPYTNYITNVIEDDCIYKILQKNDKEYISSSSLGESVVSFFHRGNLLNTLSKIAFDLYNKILLKNDYEHSILSVLMLEHSLALKNNNIIGSFKKTVEIRSNLNRDYNKLKIGELRELILFLNLGYPKNKIGKGYKVLKKDLIQFLNEKKSLLLK